MKIGRIIERDDHVARYEIEHCDDGSIVLEIWDLADDSAIVFLKAEQAIQLADDLAPRRLDADLAEAAQTLATAQARIGELEASIRALAGEP